MIGNIVPLIVMILGFVVLIVVPMVVVIPKVVTVVVLWLASE